MRKSRFSESRIIGILKEVEAGRLVKDVCHEHGISDATYYQWKSQFGGMEVSDIKRLRELEDENRKSKLMVADMSLENRAIKDVPKLTPDERRWIAVQLKQHGLSQRAACRAVSLSSSVWPTRDRKRMTSRSLPCCRTWRDASRTRGLASITRSFGGAGMAGTTSGFTQCAVPWA
jgi:putative transposase